MPRIADLISLKGRTALVTGAAGHIGRAICATLAELGADLLLVDRPGGDVAPQADALRSAWSVTATPMPCDLEQEADRKALVARVLKERRGLSVLIHAAAFVAVSPTSTPLKGWAVRFEDQSVEMWRRALEINLTAVFELTQGLHGLMKGSPGASVINVSSIYGAWGPDMSLYEGTAIGNAAGYAASKGGLNQLTRWLATTLAPDIRVNSISPGGVLRGQPESFVKRYEARTPMKRMAREDDMCGAVAYLATDLSEYVTGQDIAVDGGWGAW